MKDFMEPEIFVLDVFTEAITDTPGMEGGNGSGELNYDD